MSPDGSDSTDTSRLDRIATQWSLVREAHAAGKPQNATMARQALVLRYARAIRRYIGGIMQSSTDADELAQDAMLRLMAGDFAGANPDRGRFRDLLKTAVRNMVHNHWAKANRRRPVELDLALVEADSDGVDAEWDNAWRQTVLDHAWSALKEHQRTNASSSDFTLLQLRRDFPDLDSEGLAAKLAAKTGNPIRSDTCRQMLRRARIRFSEFLLQEVGAGLTDSSKDRVAEELAALGLLEYLHDYLADK